MAGTQSSDDRKIQRVPPLLVEEEKNKNDYYPKVVSIGPYHHGKPELASVEAFKPIAVDWFVSNMSKEFYYYSILEIITDIRNCYEQHPSIEKYLDDAPRLAEMMLLDAAFIIIYMEMYVPMPGSSTDSKYPALILQLGMLTVAILLSDLFLLENQIPLRVVKLLIRLKYGAGEDEKLIHRFMNRSIFGEDRSEMKRGEPLHLLEAFHNLVASDCGEKINWASCNKLANKKSNIKKLIHSFRSVTDLKAKGIYFRPSRSQSLKDVRFKSRFFYARLELPEWAVSIYTKVFFLNLVAYEMSPNNPKKTEVASYINLMKSLVERPEDVKELRDRKIFFNTLGSDEEVLNVFRDINTYGANNYGIFKHEMAQIEAHYNSTIKTWIAELIHTNFRSPWTITAFLTAVVLLVISAAQLYYAVHPN